jgi:hypothetical protein
MLSFVAWEFAQEGECAKLWLGGIAVRSNDTAERREKGNRRFV